MKNVCPKCHFIGIGKHKGGFIPGGILLGIGFVAFGYIYNNPMLHDTLIAGILALIAFLFAGISSIRNFYKAGKICPICNYKKMPLTTETEGQKIIQENNLIVQDTVTNICTDCKHQGISNRVDSFIWSVVAIFLGILEIISGIFIYTSPYIILGGLFILGFGIYGFFVHYRKTSKCPTCKRNTYIAIDSLEAQTLLEKKHPKYHKL